MLNRKQEEPSTTHQDSSANLNTNFFKSPRKIVEAAVVVAIVGLGTKLVTTGMADSKESKYREISRQNLDALRESCGGLEFEVKSHALFNNYYDFPQSVAADASVRARFSQDLASLGSQLEKARAGFQTFVDYEYVHPFYGRRVPSYANDIRMAIAEGTADAAMAHVWEENSSEIALKSYQELPWEKALMEFTDSCKEISEGPKRIRGCGTLMYRDGFNPERNDRIGASTSLFYYRSFAKSLSQAEQSFKRLQELAELD